MTTQTLSKWRSVVLAVTICALSADAQFTVPDALTNADIQRVPLAADIAITVIANTPFGNFTQSQSGRYWRSESGRIRQDTSFGSVITDPKARTIVYLNHLSKEATLIRMPVARRSDASQGDQVPALGVPGQTVDDLGEKVINGHEVRGKRTVTHGDGVRQFGPVTTEVWTAADLQLPIYTKQSSSRGETIQQFKNISLGEPEGIVFVVPAGYAVKEGSPPVGGQSVVIPSPR